MKYLQWFIIVVGNVDIFVVTFIIENYFWKIENELEKL